jgi:uncharacterized protein
MGGFNLDSVTDEQAAADALREKLIVVRKRHRDRVADLLFDLVHFHDRERKPAWWSIFDKIGKEAEDLIEDLECLGGLVAKSRPVDGGKSWERTYEFPEQETKLQAGTCHVEANGLPASVTLMEIDQTKRTAKVKFPKARFDAPPDLTSVLPSGPLNTDSIEAAIERALDSIVRGDGQYPAIVDFLSKSKPRFLGKGRQVTVINPFKELVPEIVSAVAKLDRSVLPIQGPPGTGKTYVSSCAILDLVRQGKRVAVASNSHKAVDNLLCAVFDRATEADNNVSIAKKGGDEFEGIYSERIHRTERNDDVQLFTASVVGGTAWLFSRVDFDASFDYLFVDEAGQVSVANIVAMATSATNIVLVGDPMQLSQPIQGAHPGESGLSALEYLLAGHNTVPAERGIFLPISRRMHPDVCRFISDTVYEGRLISDEGAARQEILGDSTQRLSGTHLIEVSHAGNSQSSSEEVAAIRREIELLLGKKFRDRDGNERPLELDDILVVAPYNLQVNALKAALPPEARVGTVDKFQGQEASHLGHYVRAIYAALVEWLVEATASPRHDPPLRYYRELLSKLAENQALRDATLALPLPALFSDVPRIPVLLRHCFQHVQVGLRRVAGGEDVESVFIENVTHRLFEAVERRRKGGRARLPRTEQGAARRVGFDNKTIRVYDLDYRWNRVRYLLWDLHRGLARS